MRWQYNSDRKVRDNKLGFVERVSILHVIRDTYDEFRYDSVDRWLNRDSGSSLVMNESDQLASRAAVSMSNGPVIESQ